MRRRPVSRRGGLKTSSRSNKAPLPSENSTLVGSYIQYSTHLNLPFDCTKSAVKRLLVIIVRDQETSCFRLRDQACVPR
jgi:hypothetical protein